MKPAAFDYGAPTSIGEATALLNELGTDAKVLAGGQSLVPLMNFRLASPAYLIDINHIAELGRWQRENGSLRLGAITRHQDLERRSEIGTHCPLLRQAAVYVGHPQIRTRGTLGGSLAHADPSAELPAAAVALEATIVVSSVRGERHIPAEQFFKFHFSTALAEDELLTAVEFPVTVPNEGSAFLEVAARFGDFAAVGATAVIRLDGDGRVARARIVCSSVGPTPVRVTAAEDLLSGRSLDDRLLEEVQAVVARSVQPTRDLKASAAYKQRTAGVLARRVVEQAATVAQRRVA